MCVYTYVGKGEKAGATLRAGKKKKGEAEKEEEEFAVSASRDEEPGKPVGKMNKRGAPAGKKSKKQQFKVRPATLMFRGC